MSWLLAFLGFAVLVVLHELGHFAAAKAVGMRVERFSLFFPPLLARVQRGETEYAIGAVPLGGYVKITGMNPAEEIPPEVAHRAYYRQAAWKRIFVIAAGPAVNIALAFVMLWGYAWANGVADPTQRVAKVEAGSPAAGVLREGDRLVAVDGVRGEQGELAERIASHRCAGAQEDGCRAEEPARVTVQRGETERTFSITPVFDAEPPPARARIGFAFEPAPIRSIGPVEAAGVSVEQMWFVTTRTVSTIAGIFYDAQKRSEVSGIVGSYETTRQSIDRGFERAVLVLALISLSLGVINLFPFLPLDGGHIFWAAAEKVRGKAIPFSVMERASLVGFALVLFLFVVGLSNDIGRLNGEGFGVP